MADNVGDEWEGVSFGDGESEPLDFSFLQELYVGDANWFGSYSHLLIVQFCVIPHI